jgi:putative transposase
MEPKIRTVYDEQKGCNRPRRITATLCHSMVEPSNHKCVQRPMQKMELRTLIRAKKRSWRVPGVRDLRVPNVLQRNSLAGAPNQKWVTDITEFKVNGHKLYLSACIDMYNSETIAHCMARHHLFDLVSGSFGAVLSRAGHTRELTVHLDQGWHYKMQPYRAMLARCGVTQSMSHKGNYFDNAVVESFFSTLKAEYFYLTTIESIEALEAGVNDYIDYYNNERIKLRSTALSP